MKRTDGNALDWLQARGGDSWTGFDPSGWGACAWLLHAMYENDELPAGLTHDEAEKIAHAADPPPPPLMVGNLDMNDLFAASIDTGTPLGASEHPGTGWRRLRWSELANRMSVELTIDERNAVFEPLKQGSWPINIRPPAENALDREQYLHLLDVLGRLNPGSAACYAYVAHLSGGSHEDDDELVFTGELSEFAALYDSEDHGVPSNLWPSDRSWFVATDTDSWATRVSGSETLVSAIVSDPDFEAVRCRGR